MIYLTRLKPQTIVSYHLLPPQRPLHDALKEDISSNYLTALTNLRNNLSL